MSQSGSLGGKMDGLFRKRSGSFTKEEFKKVGIIFELGV